MSNALCSAHDILAADFATKVVETIRASSLADAQSLTVPRPASYSASDTRTS
jgi:hypothetical protein